MDTVNIGLGLKFKTQTLADGRVVPAVEAVDVTVDINKDDIDIKISGNIWSDFASAFEIFFKGTVVDLIHDSVHDALAKTVPDFINSELATADGNLQVPSFNTWFLDWQTSLPAVITSTTVELGAKGILYDSKDGETEWSTAFPDMPYKDTAEPAQFQAYISDLSVDSLLGSYLEVGKVEGWVHGDDVPYTDKTITAGEIDVAFPGLSAKYGADSIIDVYFILTDAHSFTSSAANQDVTVLGTVKF